MHDLAEALDELYARFANYRVGADFAGCPHCVDSRDSACLRGARIRELEVHDLERYAFKALTTWGTVSEFKHFLPRLFELAVDKPAALSVEVLFGKLTYADWNHWPNQEVAAIEAYFDALWTSTLERNPSEDDPDRADSILCAIGGARESVAPLLSRWENAGAQSAIRHLGFFTLLNAEHIQRRGKLFNAYWQERSRQQREVIEWMSSTTPLRILQAQPAVLSGSFNGIALDYSIWWLEQLQSRNGAG